MAKRFQVLVYDEVHKNDEDMWVVTKLTPTDIYFEPKSEEFENKEVLKLLKDNKVIQTADQRKVNAMVGGDLIEVFEKKGGTPLCRLVRAIV